MELQFIYKKETLTFGFETDKDHCRAEIDGRKYGFQAVRMGENAVSLLSEDCGMTAYFFKAKEGIHVFIRGEKYYFEFPRNDDKFAGVGMGGGQKGLVSSPMPGTVIKLLVKEGEEVKIDQGLVIVEAMKMENEIRSTVNGKVKKIHFQPGQTVDVGQSIIDLEEEESNQEIK